MGTRTGAGSARAARIEGLERMPAQPALNRRGVAGRTSAGSLLLTVLGEFALPWEKPVWTHALVHALGLLDVEEKAARQALSRTARAGWLCATRAGRQVHWSLTPRGRQLLTEGAERIYSFGAAAQRWDGCWLVVLASVPESRRAVRHRLRTRLSWAGFGSPAPGVWVSPHTARAEEAAAVLAELGLEGEATTFRAQSAHEGQELSLVDRAWDLTALGERYEEFISRFCCEHVPEGDDARSDGDRLLAAQTRLVHEWRRFVFADPQLPAALLPAEWSGTRAARLFRETRAAWYDAAQLRWAELQD